MDGDCEHAMDALSLKPIPIKKWTTFTAKPPTVIQDVIWFLP
jgi:hypothetical protein